MIIAHLSLHISFVSLHYGDDTWQFIWFVYYFLKTFVFEIFVEAFESIERGSLSE
jgi:hypothetical protein